MWSLSMTSVTSSVLVPGDGGGELEDGKTCRVAFLMRSYTEEAGERYGAQVEKGSIRTFLREWLEEQGTS